MPSYKFSGVGPPALAVGLNGETGGAVGGEFRANPERRWALEELVYCNSRETLRLGALYFGGYSEESAVKFLHTSMFQI